MDGHLVGNYKISHLNDDFFCTIKKALIKCYKNRITKDPTIKQYITK